MYARPHCAMRPFTTDRKLIPALQAKEVHSVVGTRSLDWVRTSDLRINSPTLLPTELPGIELFPCAPPSGFEPKLPTPEAGGLPINLQGNGNQAANTPRTGRFRSIEFTCHSESTSTTYRLTSGFDWD